MPDHVCKECRSSVDPKASRCPHCGFDPGEPYMQKYRSWRRGSGILALLIIGLPIVPLTIAQAYYYKNKAEEATVAIEA